MLELCSHPAHGLGPSPAPHAVHMVGVKRKATAALHDGSAARLALLPDVLRLVESQTPHITHAEVHNFFSSADVSDAYFEENDADAIASHIASVWAAKLLLDVGSSMGSGAGAGVGPTPARHHHHHHALSSTSPDSPLDSEEGGASDMDSASDGDALRMADAHDALHAGRDDTSGSAGKAKQSRRLVWTEDLHRRFEDAVAKLGSESARGRPAPRAPAARPAARAAGARRSLALALTWRPARRACAARPPFRRAADAKPQAIQQLMNVDGITTRNIKSHLQVRAARGRARGRRRAVAAPDAQACAPAPRARPRRSPPTTARAARRAPLPASRSTGCACRSTPRPPRRCLRASPPPRARAACTASPSRTPPRSPPQTRSRRSCMLSRLPGRDRQTCRRCRCQHDRSPTRRRRRRRRRARAARPRRSRTRPRPRAPRTRPTRTPCTCPPPSPCLSPSSHAQHTSSGLGIRPTARPPPRRAASCGRRQRRARARRALGRAPSSLPPRVPVGRALGGRPGLGCLLGAGRGLADDFFCPHEGAPCAAGRHEWRAAAGRSARAVLSWRRRGEAE